MRISRIAQLQNYLRKKNVQHFVINRTDEFLGEYIAPYAERLNWLTNFSGSAGRAIISQESATLFVDGRYTVQAKEQINKNEISLDHLDNFWVVLKELYKTKGILAVDTRLHSIQEIKKIQNILKISKSNICFLNTNPIDELWKDQPPYPQSTIFNHPLKYAGLDRKNKIKKFQKILQTNKIDYYILSALDSIAWLLNIRGNNIEYTPIAFANLLIPSEGKIILFISLEKIQQDLQKEIKSSCDVHSFQEMEKVIKNIPTNKCVGMDYQSTSFYFKNLCESVGLETHHIINPCIQAKAVKNEVELEGARQANIRDGVSIAKFLFWLKNSDNINKISEIDAANYLYNIRKNNDLFYSLSFDTISAIGKHAALPHYRVSDESNLQLENNSIYLVDSGAQYKDGTTDITRTIILGNPSEEHKDRFTRVLKGHIAIATHIFSKGTTGADIDHLARKSLNEAGYDYDHGTGHGIGSFLSVHEGPQRIAKKSEVKSAELLPGMIISNEPGYYKENSFGIRIENLIIVKEKTSNLIEFETISWAPIDCDLIEKKLLNDSEIQWINRYHSIVYEKIQNFLSLEERRWLQKVTKTL